MVSATGVPNRVAVSGVPLGPTECLTSRIDRSHHLLVSSKLRPQREMKIALTPNSSCLGYRGCLRAIARARAAGVAQAHGIVAFPADHQLPDDAGGLVGQRHGRQLGWLALEKIDQPGRGMSFSPPYLLDHRCGAEDQRAAQGLIAGARDHPEPRLAGCGVVLGSEPDPCREVPAGSEG